MIKICVLASGSRGNSIYFNADGCECLIDVGIPVRTLEGRLEEAGTTASRIRHVFVTHEHEDHVRGLGAFVKKYRPETHVSRSLYLMMSGHIDSSSISIFDESFSVDGIGITPFSTLHDALDPLGFTFSCAASRFSVLTDTGSISGLMRERIRESNVVVLESNHDEHRLWHGSYPWPLKQRIAGRLGHLSNRQAAECIAHIWHPGLQAVFLAHLSEENNRPNLAKETFDRVLRDKPTRILLTHQDRISETVEF